MCITNGNILICHFIFDYSEIEAILRHRSIYNAKLLFSIIANLADIIFGPHVIWVSAIVVNLDSWLSDHFPNGFGSRVLRDGENTIELLILEGHLLILILNEYDPLR